MKKINLKGVTPLVWARIIGAGLIFANSIAISLFDFALLPFEDEVIYQRASDVATIVAGIVVGWKDTPLTVAAQKGNELTKRLKGEL